MMLPLKTHWSSAGHRTRAPLYLAGLTAVLLCPVAQAGESQDQATEAGSKPDAVQAPAEGTGEPSAPETREAPPAEATPAQEAAPASAAPEGAKAGEEAAAPEGEASEAAPVKKRSFSSVVGGFVSSSYRLRVTSGASDQDLYGYLNLDSRPTLASKVSAHLLMRFTADIDGHVNEHGAYVFDSIKDTTGSNLLNRVYYGYVDVHTVPYLQDLRIGRQLFYGGPRFLYFDGLSLQTRDLKSAFRLSLGAYGGAPVHFYEDSRAGDYLAGAYIQAAPWLGGKVKLQGLHVQDEQPLEVHRDNYFALQVTQTITEQVYLDGKVSLLNGSSRDLELRADYWDPARRIRAQASYYQLLSTEESLSVEFDPYYYVLRQYFPYWQARLVAGKAWAEVLELEGGVDVRRLQNASDESQFNHDFTRFYAHTTLREPRLKSLELGLTGELWNSQNQTRNILTGGGELSYRLPDRFSAMLGVSYSRFLYDYEANLERDDVITWSGRLKYTPFKQFMIELRYDLENDDSTLFHYLNLGLRYIL